MNASGDGPPPVVVDGELEGRLRNYLASALTQAMAELRRDVEQTNSGRMRQWEERAERNSQRFDLFHESVDRLSQLMADHTRSFLEHSAGDERYLEEQARQTGRVADRLDVLAQQVTELRADYRHLREDVDEHGVVLTEIQRMALRLVSTLAMRVLLFVVGGLVTLGALVTGILKWAGWI